MGKKHRRAAQKRFRVASAQQTQPDSPAILAAERLARQQEERGDIEAAVETLSQLLLKDPKRIKTLQELARVLLSADRLEEAAQVLTVLRAHQAEDPAVAFLLGSTLSRMRQFPEADKHLREAVRMAPTAVKPWILLAQVNEQWGKDEEAAKAIGEAVKLQPDDLDLATYAAGLLHHSGREEEAHTLLRNGSPSVAASSEARLLDALLMPIILRSTEEIGRRRGHLASTLLALREEGKPIAHPERSVLATSFLLGYHGLEDRELIEETAKTRLALSPQLGYVSPDLERPSVKGRRIKVGFLSSNMRTHSVGRVLNRFLKELNRERFEVLLFELPGKFAGGQETARSWSDKTLLVPADLEQARAMVEAEQVDLLVMPDFVLEPFNDYLAYSRMAPVQCSTWGHPGTSGRPSLDYWISCEQWEPPGNERLYTERLIRLTGPPMIATKVEPPDPILSRESLGLPEGRIYGCPQSLYKLHPEFDQIMADILRKDPEGWIVVIGGIQPRWLAAYRNRLESSFSDVAKRVIMLPNLKTERYMSLLSHCAVSLDPIHFGGANTSMEAFTMGLPVITLPGGQLRNRQTLSFYQMMDYMPLVVETPEAYVDLAVAVATDEAYREQLSREILERKDVIFDTVEITRELEGFFESAALKKIG